MRDIISIGDIISRDGRNTKNIKSRTARAINQIMEILENICFGPYYFEVALVLRNSLFLSSFLFNSEAWYNVTSNDIDDLEKVDEILKKNSRVP